MSAKTAKIFNPALLAFVAAALFASASPGRAETLTIMAGGAVTPPLQQIGAQFTKATGVTVEVVSGTSGALQQKLRAGAPADMVMLTAAVVDALRNDKLIDAASRRDLVRGLMGVCVRAGAKAPDMSSVQAFKAALLAARSVAYVDPAAGGTSGAYFEGLMQRLGIADAMKAKTVYRTEGALVARAVANGEAELGISFTSELASNPGVTVAANLPDAIQSPTVYTVALTDSGAKAKRAGAFLAALQTPAAAAIFNRARLQPITDGK